MTRLMLTKEKIIQATLELAKKIGLSKVCFPLLAEYFGIKAPSLYNYFKNMGEVKLACSIYLQKELNHDLVHAMVGLTPADALRAYAETFKDFSEQYSAVYELLNNIRQLDNPELREIFTENIRPISRILKNFDLSEVEIIQRSRMFRSTLHGFITLSQIGYFQNSDKVSKEDSFDYMITEFLSRLPQK